MESYRPITKKMVTDVAKHMKNNSDRKYKSAVIRTQGLSRSQVGTIAKDLIEAGEGSINVDVKKIDPPNSTANMQPMIFHISLKNIE